MAELSQVALSRALYELWLAAGAMLLSGLGQHAIAGMSSKVEDLPKPGPAALRARYYALKNLRPDSDPRWFDVSWGNWQRHMELVPLGERACAAGDAVRAEVLFRELEAMGRAPGAHPVVLVDAFIGLGDVERLRDKTGEASGWYSRAEDLAAANGLHLGRVRALIPWLFLQRRDRSSEELLGVADLCEQLAGGLADAMYLGNTEMVRAEILTAVGRFDDALNAAERAAEWFGDHPVALPGLYIRVADAFRMTGGPSRLAPIGAQSARCAPQGRPTDGDGRRARSARHWPTHGATVGLCSSGSEGLGHCCCASR